MKILSIPCEATGNYALYETLNNSAQDLSVLQVHGGSFSHRAYITNANAADNEVDIPHRAYGIVHLDELAIGVFTTPCRITMWVWLDILLTARPGIDDWYSFATVAATTDWDGLFVVNLSPAGYVYLDHVPTFPEQSHIYQASALNGGAAFPMREWVKLDIYYDGHPTLGYAKVFQNDVLVSHAAVTTGNGFMTNLHFGMYASPACRYALDGVSQAVVFNDDIILAEEYALRSRTNIGVGVGIGFC